MISGALQSRLFWIIIKPVWKRLREECHFSTNTQQYLTAFQTSGEQLISGLCRYFCSGQVEIMTIRINWTYTNCMACYALFGDIKLPFHWSHTSFLRTQYKYDSDKAEKIAAQQLIRDANSRWQEEFGHPLTYVLPSDAKLQKRKTEWAYTRQDKKVHRAYKQKNVRKCCYLVVNIKPEELFCHE